MKHSEPQRANAHSAWKISGVTNLLRFPCVAFGDHV